MQELELAMAAVPLPMLHIAADQRITAANAAGTEFCGAVALGRHFGLTFRQPALVGAIEAALAGGAMRRLRVTIMRDGHDLVFDVTVAPGPKNGALITLQDMTELEQVTQFRRDFVANVSHELRTPLTALMGFIETLQGPARDDVAARERFLGIMAREAGRMARLVRDLLSLSRVEAQERQRPETQVDLAGLLSGVAATLRPMAIEAGVSLTLEGVGIARMIRGDGDQLTQVFHNLVENAVKYGGNGKRVTVRLQALDQMPGGQGGGVAVSVEDQGDGIDAQHLPRLTERFYRVDTHRSREKGGTGLGLAIVKHIVSRHRGRLTIDSTRGQGSTFTVTLPVA
ncbi:MAG: two-component sensor histidine kinase [Gemmobacter sp.]|uniref:ATP-binding protein n=1 Tax=Gemmobacter sp. TaxID=1898957 RepID=UPI001A5016FA|nr:ATP-binding protein [Gemmobacter sp.]MBL8561382.1 two-component sensor histidine kinase [Gemmobacter sp.]